MPDNEGQKHLQQKIEACVDALDNLAEVVAGLLDEVKEAQEKIARKSHEVRCLHKLVKDPHPKTVHVTCSENTIRYLAIDHYLVRPLHKAKKFFGEPMLEDTRVIFTSRNGTVETKVSHVTPVAVVFRTVPPAKDTQASVENACPENFWE